MVGDDFAVHVEFAYSAGNQLCVLATEIEDEDLVVHDVQKYSQFGG